MNEKEMMDLEPVHYFSERMNVVPSKDSFAFAFQTGGKWKVFIVTPDHAKQIYNLLQRRVTEYEKQFGTLLGRLPDEPMKSPIQFEGDEPKL